MAGRYASLRVETSVRDEIQADALTLSATIGRRLSAGDLVRAAFAIARQHPDELRAALATPTEPKGTDE